MRTPTRSGPSGLAVARASLAVALATPVAAQVTSRVSVGAGGVPENAPSRSPSLSADGRYVAFCSYATNLVGGDTNGALDIFVRDRLAGTTERVSVDSSGVQGDGESDSPSISADGRYVAFSSFASNLVGGDTNTERDVFVHDRLLGTTELVSVGSGGAPASSDSDFPRISADGRYVLFSSLASNLVLGDTNQNQDAFLRDRQTGTTERVSVDSGGAQAIGGYSYSLSVSDDGRYVGFSSYAPNLVSADTNESYDTFVRDRQIGTTERVSVDSGGAQGNGQSEGAEVSADGRYVAFHALATNLVNGDTNATSDVFVHDRQSGTTERVSVDSSGAQGDDFSWFSSISADGRLVVFQSLATNLVDGDTNGHWDVFVRDRLAGTTERVSVGSSGAQSEGGYSYALPISPDGRYVAFSSDASDLVQGDTNAWYDVFVRDRLGGTDFTSLCDPGAAGVIACPCSNPPGGPGTGCDNSSGTGGASLSASGGAYLSSDSLVFTTSGEKPMALSILSQWSGTSATGIDFGMGVRCTSGTLKRLYTKTASGGSITAPDFGAGDPQVSVRSVATGDTIGAGQSRWYLVYYRDPIVLGGCPAASTFNATQTGQVTWWP